MSERQSKLDLLFQWMLVAGCVVGASIFLWPAAHDALFTSAVGDKFHYGSCDRCGERFTSPTQEVNHRCNPEPVLIKQAKR